MRRSFYERIHPSDRRELEEPSGRQTTLPPAYTCIVRTQRRDPSMNWVDTSARLNREGEQGIVKAICPDDTEPTEPLSGNVLPFEGGLVARPVRPGWASKSPAFEAQIEPPAEDDLDSRRDGPMVFADVVVEQVRTAPGEDAHA